MKQGTHRRLRRLLTPFQMRELSTPRLLAYRNRLLGAHDTPDPELATWERELTKASPEWKATYAECLAILKRREHVERKPKVKP